MDGGSACANHYNDDRLQTAAYESQEYAHAHELFLGFQTADHLHYHCGTAEYQQIPPASRSLSHEHLDSLVIPPAAVTEQWCVPRRVAGIIESACRCLDDDELKAIEGELCTRPRPRSSKLELPLLVSNPDDDCDELLRTVSAISADEIHVRNHHLQPDSKDFFAVPKQACHFADGLEDSISIETMAVSKQAIHTITSIMSNMRWTRDDGARLSLEQVPHKPAPLQTYITPPLTPVSFPIEYFVPDGDACLVSEGSDLSSRVSEALEEAEQTISDKTNNTWLPDEFDASSLEAFLPQEQPFLQKTKEWTQSGYRMDEQQELPLEPLPELGIKGTSSPKANALKQHDFEPCVDEPLFGPEELLDYESDNCLLDTSYEEISAESLLDLDDCALVVLQAKIPVPGIGPRASLPEWNELNTAEDMLRWMQKNFQDAFSCLPWPCHDCENNPLDMNLLTESAVWQELEEHADYDESLLEGATQSISNSCSLDWLDLLKNTLEFPQKRHEMADEPFLEEAIERTTTLQVIPDDASTHGNAWDAMMNRWKRRKFLGRESPANAKNENLASSQGTVKITTPELLLGSNAFASQPGQKDPQRTIEKVAEKCQPDTPNSDNGSMPILSPCPNIDISTMSPGVVVSTAMPRQIRSHILQLLPSLHFVERDYQRHGSTDDDDADIAISPSTGVVITTMVGLRQFGSRRTSAFQNRVARVSAKYETLTALIYRSNKPETNSHDLPEMSPSDALAFAQLQGFVRNLPSRVSVLYIDGGEKAVAHCVGKLLCRKQHAHVNISARLLLEAEPPQELFFRRAGLNVYDAQIVWGILKKSGSSMSTFATMSPNERLELFGSHVGCRRALDMVNDAISSQRQAWNS